MFERYNDTIIQVGNLTLVCQDPANVISGGFWKMDNPLRFSTPLFLLQLSVISLTSQLIAICLKPLGQSSIVSQIFGGIIYGPSLLGHEDVIGTTLFPIRGRLTLETSATFGLMCFLFEIGLKMDPKMMVRPNKKAIIIGVGVMIFTLVLTVPIALLFSWYISMDPSLASSLPLLVASQCLTPFPNIAILLTELKIINSELGRMALSSGMFCDLIGIALTVAGFSAFQTSGHHPLKEVMAAVSTVVFTAILVFVIRPAIVKFQSRIPQSKPITEGHIVTIFLLMLVTGLVSEIIGQHYIFGPMILGLVVPEGSPLAAALIKKLDYPIAAILYPTFLTTSGLKTNIFKVHLKSLGIVGSLVIFSSLVKIGSMILAARFVDISIHQGIVIALMMNARGICELALYNLLRDAKIFSDQDFALSVLSVIAVTAVITPLIRYMYDPSEQYAPVNRKTIQHTKRDTELRILVCIHNQDNVPSMLNLLEASNPTEDSPIAVIAVLLVELVARANPMLYAHQSGRVVQPSNSGTGRIINALHQYELHHETCVTVQSFSSVTNYSTMHDDICQVAQDQNATIIILPYHKYYEIDGSVGPISRPIRGMNLKVIDKAPCSVGIFIDRSILTGSLSIIRDQTNYNVSVIYIGGQDDAECLVYGARMVRHPNVTLTVVRFLLFGDENVRERKTDNILINEVRQENMRNDRLKYQEEVVRDGEGFSAAIKRLKDSFELILVGRYHKDSPLLVGLHAWNENTELGVVGDMLASPDFGSTASVLVVQQQRIGAKMMKQLVNPVVNNQSNFTSHDNTPLEISIRGTIKA